MGFFTGACLIASAVMFIGAKDKDMGNIVVRSITVINDNDKPCIRLASSPRHDGYFMTYNGDGKRTAYVGTGTDGGGILRTHNASGERTFALGTAKGGGGHLVTFNPDGEQTTYLGSGTSGGGILRPLNSKGKETLY